MITISS